MDYFKLTSRTLKNTLFVFDEMYMYWLWFSCCRMINRFEKDQKKKIKDMSGSHWEEEKILKIASNIAAFGWFKSYIGMALCINLWCFFCCFLVFDIWLFLSKWSIGFFSCVCVFFNVLCLCQSLVLFNPKMRTLHFVNLIEV